jgi:MAP/microtubule affinity-regulating kinase
LSIDCENLLKKFLVLNPTKRATLDLIMSDKWMNIGFEMEELKPYIEPHPDISNEERKKKMVQMGYSQKEIQDSLSENKFDEICATYILLGLQDEQLVSHPSSSSLSPIGGGLEHSISMTPSTNPPISPSPRITSGGGGGGESRHHHHLHPPSPTTKTSSAGTPSGMAQKKPSAPGVITPQSKNRSQSMRQPGNAHRRYAEYGQMPYTSSGSRGNYTNGSGSGASSRNTPEVIVNTTSSDQNHYGGMSLDTTVGGPEIPTTSSKLGNASNPNRSDIPPPNSKRKGSYDPVSD